MTNATILAVIIAIIGGAITGWSGFRFANSQKTTSERAESTPPPAMPRIPISRLRNPASPDRFADLSLWALDADTRKLAEMWSYLVQEKWPDHHLLAVVMRRWTTLDPQEALRVANETDRGQSAWKNWAIREPGKALDAAKATTYRAPVEWVIQGIATKDPDKALVLLKEDPSLVQNALDTITAELSRRGRHEEAMNIKFHYGLTMATIELRSWTKADPHAALKWCLARPYDPNAKMNRSEIFKTFLNEYPNQAHELAAILDDDQFRIEFGEHRIKKLLAQSTEGAATFVKSQPTGFVRNSLTVSLGKNIVQTDWDAAADLYLKMADEGSALVEKRLTVALPGGDKWIEIEPAVSADLLRALANYNILKTLEMSDKISLRLDLPDFADELKSSFMSKDIYGFSKWLSDQPASPSRDKWAGRLAFFLAKNGNNKVQNSFRECIGWSLSIQKPELQAKSLKEVLEFWIDVDPEGLDGHLNRPDAPAALKDAAAAMKGGRS